MPISHEHSNEECVEAGFGASPVCVICVLLESKKLRQRIEVLTQQRDALVVEVRAALEKIK